MSLNLRLRAIERCIDALCDSFTGANGDNAFNYYTESDLQCAFYGLLQRESELKITDGVLLTELVHTELPVVWKKGGVSQKYGDVLVWEPNKARHAREHWGEGSKRLAASTPAQVAIEIRHLHGGSSQLKALSNRKQIIADDDIKKLLRGKVEYGYFLAFLDDDLVNEDNPNRAKALRQAFREANNSLKRIVGETNARFRVCVVSRDGYRIRLGFSTGFPGLKRLPED